MNKKRPGRFFSRPLYRTIGWASLLIGLIVLARIPYFYFHSQTAGQHLVGQAQKTLADKKTAKWPKGLVAIVKIPSLGVTAPVVNGTRMSQLNMAVGHLVTSVAPGTPGTSILAAHNATWFRHINRLRTGATVLVINQHNTWTFQVDRKAVVHTGTPVVNSPNPSLILEACYPLNALYLTPYRYLVWTHMVHVSHRPGSPLALPPNTQYHAEGIPTAVAAQGLTLKTNYIPMGHLSIQGNASPTWRQSNAPLNAADATTTLFLAALHIARAQNPSWWHQLAPNIPYSSIQPLATGSIERFLSLANESEIVQGNTVKETSLTITVDIVGGSSPGVHTVTATDQVQGNRVRLTGWHL